MAGSEEATVEEVKAEEVPPAPQITVTEAGGRADRLQVVLALCGIVGPVLFGVVVVILGSLRPGYNHLTDFMSNLGAVGTPNAVFMSINFVVSGVLLLAFSVGLHRGIGDGQGSRTGPALIGLQGVMRVGAGVFPTDLADPSSFTQFMHGLFALGGIITIVAAPFLLYRRLKREDAWKDLATYTLATGVLLVFIFVLGNIVLPSIFQLALFGVAQRFLAGVGLLWVVVLAVRLLRLSLRPRAQALSAG